MGFFRQNPKAPPVLTVTNTKVSDVYDVLLASGGHVSADILAEQKALEPSVVTDVYAEMKALELECAAIMASDGPALISNLKSLVNSANYPLLGGKADMLSDVIDDIVAAAPNSEDIDPAWDVYKSMYPKE